jgi:hypothetical protein
MGLMVIKGVPLGDAKWIVHGGTAYAHGRQDREDSWAAMNEEVMNDPEVPEVQQPTPPNSPTRAPRTLPDLRKRLPRTPMQLIERFPVRVRASALGGWSSVLESISTRLSSRDLR